MYILFSHSLIYSININRVPVMFPALGEVMGISSVQFSCSVVSNSSRPHESQHARPPCPSPSSPRLTSIESVMPFSHLILCRSLRLLPTIPPSIRVFSNESTLHMRWPKYWSFSFSRLWSSNIQAVISGNQRTKYLACRKST